MANVSKNEVAKMESASAVFMVHDEEVRLTMSTVRNHLTRGNGKVTDQEVVMFINLCKFQKLNPWLNEAYLVKYSDNQPAQNVTGKEAYMKRAEEHPQYDGFKAGLIIARDKEVMEVEGSFTIQGDLVLGGWCEVYRKDRKYAIVAKVGFDEYNKNQSTWKSMPKTMIRKVAIVQALREAFPKDLGGMYVEEEVTFEDLPIQDDSKQKEANSKPLKIKEEPKQSIVAQDEEILEAQIIDPDEEPDF